MICCHVKSIWFIFESSWISRIIAVYKNKTKMSSVALYSTERVTYTQHWKYRKPRNAFSCPSRFFFEIYSCFLWHYMCIACVTKTELLIFIFTGDILQNKISSAYIKWMMLRRCGFQRGIYLTKSHWQAVEKEKWRFQDVVKQLFAISNFSRLITCLLLFQLECHLT